MISIAITGGIGSGKSYVSNLLKERGIPIYNADDEAKRLMLTNKDIRRDLIALLGDSVYENGVLNKPILASYLFADANNAARINRIVHPRVKADFRRWLEERRDVQIAGLECAILFEAGFTSGYVHICPQEKTFTRSPSHFPSSRFRCSFAHPFSLYSTFDYSAQHDSKSKQWPTGH